MKLNNQPKLWEIPVKLKWIELVALSISAAASTFGLYTILEPLITKQYQLFALLFAFVGFFILIDKMRRGSLVRFLNSQLSQLVESYMSGNLQLNGRTVNITPTKTKWISGLLGGVLTLVIMGADIFGGYSINATIKDKLTEYKISSNSVYQKEVNDIASGRTALENYNLAMSKWNTDRAKELNEWKATNRADKKKFEAKQAKEFSSCDKSYPASKYMFKKNRECKESWSSANKYYAIAKPAELMKPVMIATKDEAKTTKVIGTGISEATAKAEAFAEPFARGFFMLYVVLSLILNGLVLRAIFDAYGEMDEDIQQDPSLYKNAFEHWQMVRRAERHGISENKQKQETETMNIRVNLSSKLTDLEIQGELKKAAIKLKQHQIIETGGYGAIINHLRGQGISEEDISDLLKEFEGDTEEPVTTQHSQPAPVKIATVKRTKEQRVAKSNETNERPIGFNVNVVPVKAPVAPHIVNAVFDGEDLRMATELLLTGLKVGDKVMNNTQLRDAFKYSDAKGTMVLNEVGTFVKIPLSNVGVLQENSGKAYTVAMELKEALQLLSNKGMIHA